MPARCLAHTLSLHTHTTHTIYTLSLHTLSTQLLAGYIYICMHMCVFVYAMMRSRPPRRNPRRSHAACFRPPYVSHHHMYMCHIIICTLSPASLCVTSSYDLDQILTAFPLIRGYVSHHHMSYVCVTSSYVIRMCHSII